ncbi:MAG: hypothetical protein V1853_03545 [bacterium]
MKSLKPIWWGVAGLLIIAVVVFALVADSQSAEQSNLTAWQTDPSVYPLTVRLYNKQSQEALTDVQMMAIEQAVVNRSLISQTVRSNSNGVIVFTLPQGRYLIKPVEQNDFWGTSTIELLGPVTIDVYLVTRPEQATQEETE